MRTEHQTAPIEPTLTQRYERWPSSNDLESMTLPSTADATAYNDAIAASTPGRPHRSPVPMARVRDTPGDSPLPEVGDYWDLAHPDHVALAPVPLTPARPLPQRTRPAPLSTASLVTALAALPLVPVLGIGGVLGVLSVALGAAGVRQINRKPGYHGSARAITGIVLGTIAALIGVPVLLLVLVVVGV
ncbi:DUF4190 domain-containing protein [Gordonia aichiensis]